MEENFYEEYLDGRFSLWLNIKEFKMVFFGSRYDMLPEKDIIEELINTNDYSNMLIAFEILKSKI